MRCCQLTAPRARLALFEQEGSIDEQSRRVYRHGGPEELRADELDIGEPGPAEVHLRVEAVGLNRSEALFRAGAYPVALKFPTLIG